MKNVINVDQFGQNGSFLGAKITSYVKKFGKIILVRFIDITVVKNVINVVNLVKIVHFI